jgi:Arc/MetJ-type ribon-helix-helix transcriptional regulator
MTDSTTHSVPRSKIAIAIDEKLLQVLDRLVRSRVFPNRSQAIQVALEEKLERMQAGRLARECAKLDPEDEKALADEGLSGDAERWPAY